jgi:hypothetical protein
MRLLEIAKYDNGDANAQVTAGFKNFDIGISGPS